MYLNILRIVLTTDLTKGIFSDRPVSQTFNMPFYRATWQLAEGRKLKMLLVRKEEEEDWAMDISQNKYTGVLWIRIEKNVFESFI